MNLLIKPIKARKFTVIQAREIQLILANRNSHVAKAYNHYSSCKFHGIWDAFLMSFHDIYMTLKQKLKLQIFCLAACWISFPTHSLSLFSSPVASSYLSRWRLKNSRLNLQKSIPRDNDLILEPFFSSTEFVSSRSCMYFPTFQT